MSITTIVTSYYRGFARSMDVLGPVFDLSIRVWVAWAFFKSGLTKIQSWDSTLMLFQYEYAVPLLPPVAAAYLGTAAELALPVFLALGLAGRLAALALFVFNAVAVTSYPDISPAGVQQHYLWGTMMLITLFHGPGRLSVDNWLSRRYA